MASLPTLIPLAVDVDHVAAYKALISRRSQRGRQLQDYFDQIVAGFRARDDFLMAHINSLQKTLDDHGIPLPTPGRRATTPLENVSVGQQETHTPTRDDGEPSHYTTDSEGPERHARVSRKRSSSESQPSPKRAELSRLSQSPEESSSSSASSSPSAMPAKAKQRLRKWNSARGSRKRGHISCVHPSDSSSRDHVSEHSELPSSEARTSPLESGANVASEGSVVIKREAVEDEHGEMSKDNNSQPADDESVIRSHDEFEIFSDPLFAPSITSTISRGDGSSLAGGSELEEPENIDPQDTVDDDLSDYSGESRSGASLVSFDYGQIHPALLQTFYHAGSERGRRSRYDADYESSDVDEGNGSVANDTEANDTVDNDTDVATEVIIKTEPEESLLGSFPPSEEVRIKVEKEESLGGSLSPREIAQVAPANRARTNGVVRGWAQGVARATAVTEPDAGPVAGIKPGLSPAGTVSASQDISPTIKREKGSRTRNRKGGRQERGTAMYEGDESA